MSLDATDAETVRRRCLNWASSGEIRYDTLIYQMGGRPGVDPYGWQRHRVDDAIRTGIRLGFLETVERATGTHIRANEREPLS